MLCTLGRVWRLAVASVLLTLAPAIGLHALAKGPSTAEKPAETTIAVAQLPVQGQQVLALIYQGGPFKHDKDGTVFGNRERLLPQNPRGYYREYTVRTPGVGHRGARRIVCGGKQATAPDACYYTDDHYASFRRIAQ
jgi:ribonuclease T1